VRPGRRVRLGPWLLVALQVSLSAACFVCPDGELRLVAGALPVAPGESVGLAFWFDGELLAGAQTCGGHWHVDGVEGGSRSTGTVTACGVYRAPLSPARGQAPVVSATLCPQGACADCCPFAERRIELRLPP